MYNSIFGISNYSERGLRNFFFLLELEFHAFKKKEKIDCLIPIAAFRKPYSGILNGTRAP